MSLWYNKGTLKTEGNVKQTGIYDEDNRLTKLSKLGDSPEKLSGVIEGEMFRRPHAMAVRDESKAGKGRPPYDVVLMFKILVLQRYTI